MAAMGHYDEDIAENPFFQHLCQDFPDAYKKAVSDGWILCIPRSGSYTISDLTDDDILSHILLPDSDDATLFHTITNKVIRKEENSFVLDKNEKGKSRSVQIMFSETCYTEDLTRHTICCLEGPLCTSSQSRHVPASVNVPSLTGMHDCLSFLWAAGSGHVAINAVNKCCGMFVENNPNLKTMSLGELEEKMYQLYVKTLKLYCDKGGVDGRCQRDAAFSQSIRLALETYILYLLSGVLTEGLLAATAADDAALNKIIQNLQDLQPTDVGVRSQFCAKLSTARRQLLRLHRQPHPLGKYHTLRRVARELDAADAQLSSDDLLPCFVVLILKTPLGSWMTQLALLKRFHFSVASANTSEYGFLAATLEAALEHIKSGALRRNSVSNGEAKYSNKFPPGRGETPGGHTPEGTQKCQENVATAEVEGLVKGDESVGETVSRLSILQIQALFAAAASDDVDRLEYLLGDRGESSPHTAPDLCHPLCSCSGCCSASLQCSGTAVRVFSVDAGGRTPLHVAAAHNAVRCVEVLGSRGAPLDARDNTGRTPLYEAAARGHQRTVLLLLHLGAAPARRCRRGDTPLHVAANNAHAGCVQALLYHAEQTGAPAGVGAANRDGETPLHLAARWGYTRIAELLAAHGAQSDVLNRRRQTPADAARDHLVRERLLAACDHYRQSAPRAFVRLLRGEPSPPEPPPTVGGRATRRLFAAIVAGDERLACFYLGLSARSADGMPQALCHPLCSCARCAPLAAQRSSSPLPVWTRDEASRTPLHAALSARLLELSRLLLDAGADMNAADADGRTPLHCACAADFGAGAAELLARGADVGSVDTAGRSALHVACGRQQAELCRRLLRAGADRAARCRRGHTPLEHAPAGTGRAALARLLAKGAGGDVATR